MTDDVTQAEVDAANDADWAVADHIVHGSQGWSNSAGLIYRHRQAAEQATVDKIVAWLRGLPCCSDGSQTAWVADAIQRGEWKQ